MAILNVGRNDNNWKIIDIANLIQSKVDGCNLEFIGKALNGDEEDLIRDRKIQDGVDKRTYQVSFDRIHLELPGFKSRWTVDQGIEQLILDLERLELNEIKFKQRDFYRLQQAEHLHRTNQMDQELNIKW